MPPAIFKNYFFIHPTMFQVMSKSDKTFGKLVANFGCLFTRHRVCLETCTLIGEGERTHAH